jgi:hypothetical protein
MTYEFNPDASDRRFNRNRNEFLLKTLRQADERDRLREMVNEFEATEPPPHAAHRHHAAVSVLLQALGVGAYIFAAFTWVINRLIASLVSTHKPENWANTPLIIFGCLVLLAFFFYYSARPLLSSRTCWKCRVMLLGLICAGLSSLWGLCQHLEQPLGEYRIELFVSVAAAMLLPEISHWLRRHNQWLRQPRS